MGVRPRRMRQSAGRALRPGGFQTSSWSHTAFTGPINGAQSHPSVFHRREEAEPHAARGHAHRGAQAGAQARRAGASGRRPAGRAQRHRRRGSQPGQRSLGSLATIHRRARPQPVFRPLHAAGRAAPGYAAGGDAAWLSPDRAGVRARVAHEPVGRRRRIHGAVPAAIDDAAGAALLALVPARRAARRRRGRPDRRLDPGRGGAPRAGP